MLVVTLARKPLNSTVAQNVLKHGTGGLAIDASRISTASPRPVLEHTGRTGNVFGSGLEGSRYIGDTMVGRFPANLILTPEAAVGINEQSIKLNTLPGHIPLSSTGTSFWKGGGNPEFSGESNNGYEDRGPTSKASRFFKNIASVVP